LSPEFYAPVFAPVLPSARCILHCVLLTADPWMEDPAVWEHMITAASRKCMLSVLPAGAIELAVARLCRKLCPNRHFPICN
jgi:hypothetical protein